MDRKFSRENRLALKQEKGRIIVTHLGRSKKKLVITSVEVTLFLKKPLTKVEIVMSIIKKTKEARNNPIQLFKKYRLRIIDLHYGQMSSINQ